MKAIRAVMVFDADFEDGAEEKTMVWLKPDVFRSCLTAEVIIYRGRLIKNRFGALSLPGTKKSPTTQKYPSEPPMREVTCAILDDSDFRPGTRLEASRQVDLLPDAFDRSLKIQLLVHRARVIKNRVGAALGGAEKAAA